MMSSIVRSTVILLAVRIFCADSLTLPYNFIGGNAVGSSAFCMIDYGTNLMNPQTVKIPKTLPLATAHAGGNVDPPTTNYVAPPLIDWNLVATTQASNAAASFVAISRMILVIIGAYRSKIVIQGEEVAMTPSPTILTRSALDACSASHVDALCKEDKGSSAFEETILRSLGGADTNRMRSQTLEITRTRTLEDIYARGDNALALGNEGECALALAFEETISRLEETTCKAAYKILTYLDQDTIKPWSDPNLTHVAEGIEDFLLTLVLHAAVLFAVICMMIYKITGATCLSKIIVSVRGMMAIQPSTLLTFFTVVACFSGHAHAKEEFEAPCYGSYGLPATYLDGSTYPFINGTIDQAGDGWGENIVGWNGAEYRNTSFVQVYLYVSGDQPGNGQKALAGRAFVGYGFPYLCVAAYLDYDTDGNTTCTVEDSTESAYVNYNNNQNNPNPKLTSETPGANFRYVRYSAGTFGRVIGK
ncbi:hypothetical protein ACHAW5_010388 [Stephanodiscus triporus]|uniref:Uncharacterized protein n=1 Tax=Stephanodiscus triporus TaxID=2934178 RepID=A0ABD3QIP1_9STRA